MDEQQRMALANDMYQKACTLLVLCSMSAALCFGAAAEAAGAPGALDSKGQCLAKHLGKEELAHLVHVGANLLGFSSVTMYVFCNTENLYILYNLYISESLRLNIIGTDLASLIGQVMLAIMVGQGMEMPYPFGDKFSFWAIPTSFLLAIAVMNALKTMGNIWTKLTNAAPSPTLSPNEKVLNEAIEKLQIFVKRPDFLRRTIPATGNSPHEITAAVTEWLDELGQQMQGNRPQSNQHSAGWTLSSVQLTKAEPAPVRLAFMMGLTSLFHIMLAWNLVNTLKGPLLPLAFICVALFGAMMNYSLYEKFSHTSPELLPTTQIKRNSYTTTWDSIPVGLFYLIGAFSWVSMGNVAANLWPWYSDIPPDCRPIGPGEVPPNPNISNIITFFAVVLSFAATNALTVYPLVGEPPKVVRQFMVGLLSTTPEVQPLFNKVMDVQRFEETWGEQIFNEWRFRKVCRDIISILKLYKQQVEIIQRDVGSGHAAEEAIMTAARRQIATILNTQAPS